MICSLRPTEASITAPPLLKVTVASKDHEFYGVKIDNEPERLGCCARDIILLLAGENASVPFLGKMSSVVVFQAEVRDQLFAAEVAEGVLELHHLDEDVVLGV